MEYERVYWRMKNTNIKKTKNLNKNPPRNNSFTKSNQWHLGHNTSDNQNIWHDSYISINIIFHIFLTNIFFFGKYKWLGGKPVGLSYHNRSRCLYKCDSNKLSMSHFLHVCSSIYSISIPFFLICKFSIFRLNALTCQESSFKLLTLTQKKKKQKRVQPM